MEEVRAVAACLKDGIEIVHLFADIIGLELEACVNIGYSIGQADSVLVNLVVRPSISRYAQEYHCEHGQEDYAESESMLGVERDRASPLTISFLLVNKLTHGLCSFQLLVNYVLSL